MEQRAPNTGLPFFYLNGLLTILAVNMFAYLMVIYSNSLGTSNLFSALVFFGVFGPSLLLGPYAGTVLDRYSRKWVLFGAQTFLFLTLVVFAACVYFGVVRPETKNLMLLSFLVGVAQAFVIPARFALLGNLVADSDLGRKTVLLNLIIIVGFGSNTLVAGYLREVLNWKFVFIAQAVLFGAAVPLVLLLRPAYHNEQESKEIGAFESLRIGLRFIGRHGLVLELIAFTIVGFFMVGPLQVLLPKIAQNELGLGEFGRGALLAVLGGGLFVGGVIAKFLNERKNRGTWILAACLLVAGVSAGISGTTTILGTAMALALVGVFGGILATLIPAAVQTETPDAVRGRVMGIYSLIFRSTPGVAALATGLAADSFSLRGAAYLGAFFVLVASAFSVLLLKKLRNYE